MNEPPPSLPSPLRLTRLLLWVGLWLQQALHALEQVGVGGWFMRTLRPHVADVRDLTIGILLCFARNAAPMRARAKPCRAGFRKLRTSTRRLLVGGRLRRLLRGASVREEIAALVDLLRNFEAEIARAARRFRIGLTRIFAALFAPALALPTLACVAPEFGAANSS